MICAKNLSKIYGKKTILSDLNMDIPCGTVVGLLGKNGAGKTTFNKILTGLSFPTSGSITVCGSSPKCGNGKISFLSENISIYPTLSAYDNLAQIFLINNLKPDQTKIHKLLEDISIENSSKPASKFSLGMKRRLQIAMSILVVDRDIIILDEPTNGLDINGVLWLQELLTKLKKENKTIIMTSHAIKQLESSLTSYFILDKGKIVGSGDMNSIDTGNIVIKFMDVDFERAMFALSENRILFEKDDLSRTISINNVTQDIYTKCMGILVSKSIIPLSFENQKQSLVDIFVSLTDSSRREND